MNLNGKVVLLTGASGGIGQAIAHQLARRGARLILVGRAQEQLAALAQTIDISSRGGFVLNADITTHDGREKIRTALAAINRPLDVLINCAGISLFKLLPESDPDAIERLITTNVTASILLTRLALGFLNKQDSRVINIGSSFGALGYPGFAVYCASKFALRGFSEALRRELSGSAVQVAYLAPRATKTALNNDAVCALNSALGNTMDEPEVVARRLEKMLLSKRMHDANIGWPERLFIRINSLFPRLIDLALRKQLPTVLRFAQTSESLPETRPMGKNDSRSTLSMIKEAPL